MVNYTGPNLEANGGTPVNIQDQHSDIIDLHLTEMIDTMTLTAGASVDDTTISVDSATLPVVGNMVCLKETYSFYQGEVVTVTPTGGSGYDLDLDTPLDYAYTVAGGCSLRDKNLKVDGSSTSRVFSVSPSGLTDPQNPANPQRWDIVRVTFVIDSSSSGDTLTFGGISGLTNGIVVRKKNGTYKNIFNSKTNGDFASHSYDIEYDDRAGGGGTYSFRCRRTFGGQSKNGVTVRLNAADDDEFQVIVQDDLTALARFHVIAQGHIVEN